MNTKQAILCVDDEKIILTVLKNELIQNFGSQFFYEMAESGEEALEVFEDLDTERIGIILILSDWLMPGIKGDEFLAQVHKKYPHIKAIMISGHADKNAIEKAKQNSNLSAFISKPWKSEELLEAVKKCIE